MELVLVGALPLLVAGLFWILVRAGAEKIRAQYVALSKSLGLELTVQEPVALGFVRPDPHVHGTHRGHEISIAAAGKGLQDTRKVETVIKIGMGAKGFRMQLTSSGVGGRLRQRDSGNLDKWTSGDSEFDSLFDLRTNNPSAAALLLDASLRSRVGEVLRKTSGTLYVADNRISYVEFGLINSEATRERFERIAGLMIDLADALDARA